MGHAKAIADGREGDPLEEAVDEAIELAGGDPRAAIRGLILGQQSYEKELRGTVSFGYVRRGLKSRERAVD